MRGSRRRITFFILPDDAFEDGSRLGLVRLGALDQRECAELSLEVPLQMSGDEAARLISHQRRCRLRERPLTTLERDHQIENTCHRRGRTRRPAMHTDRSARRDMERSVWSGGRAACALGQCRCPAGKAHRTQQEGVENQFGRSSSLAQCTQSTDRQLMQATGRRVLLAREPFRCLENGAPSGVAAVVGHDVAAEGIDRVHLSDDVEVAPRIEQNIDVGEGSSRAPNFDLVRRTPFATARTMPLSRVNSVTMRSASPSLCWRSTTALSR